MSVNRLFLDKTPLYADIISLVNDFNVGNQSYWKNNFNSVIEQINRHGLDVWNVKYDIKKRMPLVDRDWKLICRDRKIKTKKDIVNYMVLTKTIREDEVKQVMKMKKDKIIKYHFYQLLYFVNDKNPNYKNTIHSKYFDYFVKQKSIK